MAVTGLPVHKSPLTCVSQAQVNYFPCKHDARWRGKRTVIRCCIRSDARTGKNYYELLGVTIDSSAQQIKEAYRKLQKRYHPDIAGQQGHEHSLMLNEAYKVLMREDLKREYDASIGEVRVGIGRNSRVMGFSTWNGPLKPQALFVDENACIHVGFNLIECHLLLCCKKLEFKLYAGCRECVHHANNTFMMDEATGSARVKVQDGDDEQQIKVSVDSCPVNCIHRVDMEELPVLEYLIQPKPKDGGYGIFGQGWEKPVNVFMAAKAFNKKLQREAEHPSSYGRSTEEETPAQAEARVKASQEIQKEKFSWMWQWDVINKVFGSEGHKPHNGR